MSHGPGRVNCTACPDLQMSAAASPQALVLAPTRELAMQIEVAAKEYGSKIGVDSVVVSGVRMRPDLDPILVRIVTAHLANVFSARILLLLPGVRRGPETSSGEDAQKQVGQNVKG